MNVVIIYGSERRGNTWTLTQKVRSALEKRGEYVFTEYYLPRDLPEFCSGCMTCLKNGRERCPHSAWVAPIERDILACDALILSSPVYVMDVSGPMKAFLDHLFTLWIPHRPEAALFHKAGLVVSTAAGAGTGSANKTMERSLKYWGVPQVCRLGLTQPTSESAPARMEREADRAADKLHKALGRRERAKPSPYIRMMFGMMARMQGKALDVEPLLALDNAHWHETGYLAGKRPWKTGK